MRYTSPMAAASSPEPADVGALPPLAALLLALKLLLLLLLMLLLLLLLMPHWGRAGSEPAAAAACQADEDGGAHAPAAACGGALPPLLRCNSANCVRPLLLLALGERPLAAKLLALKLVLLLLLPGM